MQIANAEFRPSHVDGEIHSAATAQVLDIAITAVFRSTGDYNDIGVSGMLCGRN